MFKSDFFSDDPISVAAYHEAVGRTVETLLAGLPRQPFAGTQPAELTAKLGGEICPAQGKSLQEVLENLQKIIEESVAVWHPHTAAHLHTPVLISSLMAELVLTALNPSMDSYDQAPAATIIELLVLEWLCRLVGLPQRAGGTFTAGGTQSNYMGLLLARDHFIATRWQWSVMRQGLPAQANRLRILCSEIAHFSIEKSAMQLGLGTQAVVKVAVDERFRLRPEALAAQIEQLRQTGLEPFAVVATAGTTDFGSIDPLESIASLAREQGLWLHVDAAYGGALLLSQEQQAKLKGIEQADSVTIDFHKAFFQPISCGAFLLADDSRFELIRLHADYLNPESHEKAGIPDLVTRSVLTTRRFDALKLWVSLQRIGREQFAAMVEHLVTLAQGIAAQIALHPRLELLNQPEFGCVVFRYCPQNPTADVNAINQEISLKLFREGAAVLGHTHVHGRECLKLTLNNPCITLGDLHHLLEKILHCGHQLETR